MAILKVGFDGNEALAGLNSLLQKAKDLQKTTNDLTRSIDRMNNTLAKSGGAKGFDSLNKSTNELNRSLNTLDGSADKVRDSLSSIKTNSSISRLSSDARSLSTNISASSETLEEFNRRADRIGDTRGIMNLNNAFIKYSSIAYGAMTVTKSLVKAFTELELAEAGVIKTTGFSSTQIKKLSNDLKGMAQNVTGLTKGFNIDNLYKIAEQAGQLGIKSQKDILKFTTEIQKMVLTSELSANQASEGFAKLSNSLNHPIQNVDKLLSLFTGLASATTVNEKKLLNYVQRLAGTGKTIGLTVDQIGALGATLADVGLTAEVSGTAFSKLMQKMMSNTGDMADAVGLDYKRFAKLVKDEPVVAIQVFLKKLGELDKQARIVSLEDLKMAGSGISSTLLKMSANTVKLTANLKVANQAYSEGTALEKEYLAISNTLHAQQVTLDSSFKILKATLFNGVAPAYKDLIQLTTDAVNWGTEHANTLIKTAKVIGMVTIAWKGLSLAFSLSPIGRVVAGLTLIISTAVKAYNMIKRVIRANETKKQKAQEYLKYIKSEEYLSKKREKAINKVIQSEKGHVRAIAFTKKILSGKIRIGREGKQLTASQKKVLQKNLSVQEKQLKNLRLQVREYKKIYSLSKKTAPKISRRKTSLPNIDSPRLPMDRASKAERAKSRATEKSQGNQKLSHSIEKLSKAVSPKQVSKPVMKVQLQKPKVVNKAPISKMVTTRKSQYNKPTTAPLPVLKASRLTIEKPTIEVKLHANTKELDESIHLSLYATERIEEELRVKKNRLEALNIQEKIERYKRLGRSIRAIGKLQVRLEIVNLANEKMKLEAVATEAKRIAREQREEFNRTAPIRERFISNFEEIGLSSYQKKLLNLNRAFEEYKSAGIDEEKLHKLYISEISILAKEQIAIEAQKGKELDEQLRREKEKTTETQKQLKGFTDFLSQSLQSTLIDLLLKYPQGVSLNDSIDKATDNTQSSLMNSGSMYGVIVGGVGALLSGFNSNIVKMETDQHKDNQTLINSQRVLEDVSHKQLEITRQIAFNTARTIGITSELAVGLGTGRYQEELSKAISLFAQRDVGSDGSRLAGFYSTKHKTLDFGLAFQTQSYEDFKRALDVQSYILREVKQKSVWGVISTTRQHVEGYDDVSQGFKNSLQNAVISSVTDLQLQAQALGVDTSGKLNNLNIDFGNISTKDKTNKEIQDSINGEIGNILDNATNSLIGNLLSSFQGVDESTYETLTRVATGLTQGQEALRLAGIEYIQTIGEVANTKGDVYTEVIRESLLNTGIKFGELIESSTLKGNELLLFYRQLDKFNFILQSTNGSLANVSQGMIDGAGGIDKLTNAQSSYLQNFYSESEQSAIKISELNRQFEALGLETPKNADALRTYMESLDTGTKAGSELYGQLLVLSSAFYDAKGGIEGLSGALGDLVQSSYKTQSEVIQGYNKQDNNQGIKSSSADAVGKAVKGGDYELANELFANLASSIDRTRVSDIIELGKAQQYIAQGGTDTNLRRFELSNYYYEQEIQKSTLLKKQEDKKYDKFRDMENEMKKTNKLLAKILIENEGTNENSYKSRIGA